MPETTNVRDGAAPPSPPSSSSNTPVTDNRGELVADDQELPKSTHQPILETIETRQEQDIKMTSNNDPAQAEDSPRSIDMKQVPPQTQALSPLSMPPPAPASARPHHRKTLSEEQIAFGQQYYGGPAPPYNMHPQQMLHSPRIFPGAQPPPHARRTPPGGSRRSRHSRSQSWNNLPPMMGLSPAGNPLIPVLQDPNGDFNANTRYSPVSGSRRKRSYSHSGQLFPTGVSYAGPGSYGSFEGQHPPNSSVGPPSAPLFAAAPQSYRPETPPPLSAPQQYRPENFSPGNEIRSLTKGLSSRQVHSSPGYSRTMGSPRVSPRISPKSGSAHHSPAYPRHDSNVRFSAGTHLENPYNASASVRGMQQWRPDSDAPPSESDLLIGGGEAVFDARNRTKRRNGTKHMRQRSAQLFMEDVKGVPQVPACRDVLFVLLFVFHLLGMTYLGSTFGREALTLDDDVVLDEAVTLSYRNVMYVACLCGAFAMVVSACTLVVMMSITKRIVQVALFLTIAMSFAWGTIGVGVSPKNFVPITGIIALTLSIAYAFVVWDRIPFAAANLHSGLSAVRANIGTVLVAFCLQGIALGWTIYYTFVVIGVFDAVKDGDLALSNNMEVFVYTMLGISYYWTFHVLMNVVQVTVAATIGSWWFKPDSSGTGFCNESIQKAFFTTMFYSFGSICFGSLLIGPVRLIRQLSAFFRPTQEDSILMCLHECVNCIQQCIANCVDNLSAHFNSWALAYVGLYGYGLLDAGHNATELFETRGWTTIVSDDLVANVLLMFSVVVGGLTGCFGIFLQKLDKLNFSNIEEPTMVAFGIGLGVGLVLTSVLFAIITASVNAVIVCFAGSPLEFERNHPKLSVEMRAAWGEVWPGCMDAVDMTVDYMASGVPPLI